MESTEFWAVLGAMGLYIVNLHRIIMKRDREIISIHEQRAAKSDKRIEILEGLRETRGGE